MSGSSSSTGISSGKTHRVSPMSSTPHNNKLTMASGLILDFFGPTVQSIFDCLAGTGDSTFESLSVNLKKICAKTINIDRIDILNSINKSKERKEMFEIYNYAKLKAQEANDTESFGYVVEPQSINAALIVLMTHQIVTAERGAADRIYYCVSINRACQMGRYPRYHRHILDTFGQKGGRMESVIVKIMLSCGIMTSEEILQKCPVKYLEDHGKADDEDDDDDDDDEDEPDEDAKKARAKQKLATAQNDCIKSLNLMIGKRIMKEVKAFEQLTDEEVAVEIANKRQKYNELSEEDQTIERLLTDHKKTLPSGSVWSVNLKLLDDRMLASKLGDFAAARITNAEGADCLTAALWCLLENPTYDDVSLHDVKHHLPVKEDLDPESELRYKELQSDNSRIYAIFQQFSKASNPIIVNSTNTVGSGKDVRGARFNINNADLLKFLKQRTLHSLMTDRYGEMPARVFAILSENEQYLESDTIADIAMIPVKECRECLHLLFRRDVINFHDFPLSKQHNYNTTIYLWNLDRKRVRASVESDLCKAYANLRDRRRVLYATKADVLERIKAKQFNQFSVGDSNLEKDKREEKEVVSNLNWLDQGCVDADDVLLLISKV